MIATVPGAGGGPGFLLLALVVAALCLVVVPLAQVLLLRTPRFKGRHFTACGVALLIALGMLPLVAIIGNFNIC